MADRGLQRQREIERGWCVFVLKTMIVNNYEALEDDDDILYVFDGRFTRVKSGGAFVVDKYDYQIIIFSNYVLFITVSGKSGGNDGRGDNHLAFCVLLLFYIGEP